MTHPFPDKRSRLPDQQVVELCDLLRDLVDRNMAWTVTFRAHVIKGITKMSDQAKEAPVSARNANAERYEWLRSFTGADRFGFQLPYPAIKAASEGVNLLQGSVAQHLDEAIDKARGARSDGESHG